ncbi:MAG: hypothetical protein WCY09_01610, partial [Candidatus Omnitrophota bacterium]
METEDRLFSLEYFLTVLLLLPLLFFFPQEVYSLRIYFVIGIIIGAVFAWISRGQFPSISKLITLGISILILAWVVYSLFKSTFFYREVIIICIKGLSLLIIVNSFSSSLEGHLVSMQIFSILLFFCICAITKEYSQYFLILISGFVFNLAVLARAKLQILFKHLEKGQNKHQPVNLLLVILLILAALSAWVLFMNVPFREIRTWGYLKNEDLIPLEEEVVQEEASDIVLQDEQIQKQLTDLTLKLSSADEMHRVLTLIQDLLVQQAPYAFDVSNAERDILKVVNDPSLVYDMQTEDKLNDSVKSYVNKKILKNIAQTKEDIGKIIQDNHIGFMQRLAILSAVKKMEYSSSLRGIDKYNQQLKEAIDNKYVSHESKKQLSRLSKQLREWKSYQVYRKKLDSLVKNINSLNGDKKQDFGDLIQEINNVNKTNGTNFINKRIEKLSAGSLSEEAKLLEEASGVIDLRKEMIAFKENSQMREKLENFGGDLNKPDNFDELLNGIEESSSRKDAAKKIGQLLDNLRDVSNFQMPQEVKSALQSKLENLIKESAEAIKKQIKENGLQDSGKNLLEDLKKIISEDKKDKLLSLATKMQKSIEEFNQQGNLSKEASDNLVNEIKTIKDLLVMKQDLTQLDKQEDSLSNTKPADYREKISELLQSSSLENQQRELIEKLMEKLASAQTVSQVEDVLSAINQE